VIGAEYSSRSADEPESPALGISRASRALGRPARLPLMPMGVAEQHDPRPLRCAGSGGRHEVGDGMSQLGGCVVLGDRDPSNPAGRRTTTLVPVPRVTAMPARRVES